MTDADPIAIVLGLVEQFALDVPLEEALVAVIDAAMEVVPGDHASIALIDESGNELAASARAREGREPRSIALRRGGGIAGWVMDERRSARIADTRLDPRFFPTDVQGFGIRSLVAAPLLHRNRAFGVLAVSSAHAARFDEKDERLVRLLATCAVPALEQARLHQLATTDDLTLAHNARYLMPRLREEIERVRRSGKALSVAMLDLDHFDETNAAMGKAMGDHVLRTFADRVRDQTGHSDVFVRQGGDRFALVLPGTQSPQAAALVERIRLSAATPIALPGGDDVVQTVSIGLASWNGDELAGALVHRADFAMYEAKRAGRNRVAVAAPRA